MAKKSSANSSKLDRPILRSKGTFLDLPFETHLIVKPLFLIDIFLILDMNSEAQKENEPSIFNNDSNRPQFCDASEAAQSDKLQ